MAEDNEEIIDSQDIKTQTQKSQIHCSQTVMSSIPTIWGRLYFTKISINGKTLWKYSDANNSEYFGT